MAEMDAALSSLPGFFKGKRVLVTGHTGFKGSWLCVMLQLMGAEVMGYALPPAEDQILYRLSGADGGMAGSAEADIRDFDRLRGAFDAFRPQFVVHMAAQPIVREGYARPRETYETNVMGTVNLLECVRLTPGIISVLNVTTDKVYENREWAWGYRETDPLDGYDPYSNSKSCSELVTHSYKKSFFDGTGIAVSTARAGNVIGGGDFAADRIIPDCVRAALSGGEIVIRNPYSVRPFQHVIEPLAAYLMILAAQARDPDKQGYYNVGPGEGDCVTVGELADMFCESWGGGISWKNVNDGGPHEAAFLKLDCSLIAERIGWRPRRDIAWAVEKTVEWAKAYRDGGDVRDCMERQIKEYIGL